MFTPVRVAIVAFAAVAFVMSMSDENRKVTKADMDHLKHILPKLATWFHDFGNYTRSGNIDRLLDGIKEYESDILS